MEAPLCRSPRGLSLLGMVGRAQGFRVTSEPEARGTEERRLNSGSIRKKETHAELGHLHSPRSASVFVGRCAHAQWKGGAAWGRGLSRAGSSGSRALSEDKHAGVRRKCKEVNPLSVASLANIFSYSEGCTLNFEHAASSIWTSLPPSVSLLALYSSLNVSCVFWFWSDF